MFKSLLKATLLAVCVLLIATATGGAREYVVHTCKLPDGRPAPTDGWSSGGSVAYSWFSDACARGGSLSAGLGGVEQPVGNSLITWGFNSGAATIRGYRIVRSGTLRSSSPGVSMYLFTNDAENRPNTGRPHESCTHYQGCTGIAGLLTRTTVPDDSHAWFFSMGCGGYVGWSCTLAKGAGDFGSFQIDSASFTLDDSEVPSTGAAEGSLTAAGATSGSLRLTAEDAVSGLRRATVEVDGNVVATAAPDPATLTCSEVGQSSLPDFTLRRPCPAKAQFELTLGEGQVPEGEHVVRARVYDAAGNGATAFGPRTVAVRGITSLATAGIVPDQSTSLLASFGRTLNVTGTLVSASGRAVAGATIVATQLSPTAFTARRTSTLTTDSAGRWSLRVRATSNRSIELAHAESGAVLSMRLATRSKVRLRAARHNVPSLGRMQLTGSIQTERARRGASVAIKVRQGRGWRTIGITRASTRGHFKFDYRFRRTRHATFIFRAVVLRSGDVVVSPTPSNRVRVRVG
jgi:hypothetical protein